RGGLRLSHGALHGLVRRQPVRGLRVQEPSRWAVCARLLDHDFLQRRGSADLLDAPRALQPGHRVDRFGPDQPRHVDRALRHHRDLSASRLHAIQVVDVLPDLGRLEPVRRHHQLLLDVLTLVPAVLAGGCGQRDQGAAGRDGARPGGALTRQTWVLGEFATPQGMLGAVRHLRRLGYKNLDTYSPYPVEGSSEALGLPRSRVALFVLVGGLVGATLGYLLQYFCNVYDFPINIGGEAPPHPPHPPPAAL